VSVILSGEAHVSMTNVRSTNYSLLPFSFVSSGMFSSGCRRAK
jgi:hypothetical protein